MARSVLYPHEKKSEPPKKRSKKKDGEKKETALLPRCGTSRRWVVHLGIFDPVVRKVQWRSRLKKKRKDPRGSDLQLR